MLSGIQEIERERDREDLKGKDPWQLLWRIVQSHLCLVFLVQEGGLELNRAPEATY